MAEKVILLMSTLVAIRYIQKDDDQNFSLYLLAHTILSTSLDLFEIPIAAKRRGSYGLYYGCTLIPGILLCMATSSGTDYENILKIILKDLFTCSSWLMIFLYFYLALHNFQIFPISSSQLGLNFPSLTLLIIAKFICGVNNWTILLLTVTLFAIVLTSEYLLNCFTSGELALLLQILFTFLRVFTSNANLDSVLSLLSCQIMVFLVIIITCLVFLNFFGLLSPITFYICCSLLFPTFTLYVLMTSPQNILIWGFKFLFDNFPYRQVLIGFWLLELGICIVYVMFRPNYKSSTVERKLFHIFILFTYTPAILYDMELIVLGSVLATSVLMILEAIRALGVTAIAPVLDEKFRVFLDPQDTGCLILTPIYLLLGQCLPIWASFFEHGRWIRQGALPISIYSGLASVAIGDSAASVVGSKFGRFKWPGSNKTVEGTAAAFMSQILFLISCCGLHAMSFHVMFTIAAVSLVEAFTAQIDNLILPIFMYFLLNCNNLMLSE